MSEVVSSKVIGDEFVEVVRRYPQWASIPESDRATHQMIDQQYSPHARPKRHRVLDAPACIVAVYDPHLSAWCPCSHPTYGADRCKSHGGPGMGEPEIVRLRRENEQLRAAIAAKDAE